MPKTPLPPTPDKTVSVEPIDSKAVTAALKTDGIFIRQRIREAIADEGREWKLLSAAETKDKIIVFRQRAIDDKMRLGTLASCKFPGHSRVDPTTAYANVGFRVGKRGPKPRHTTPPGEEAEDDEEKLPVKPEPEAELADDASEAEGSNTVAVGARQQTELAAEQQDDEDEQEEEEDELHSIRDIEMSQYEAKLASRKTPRTAADYGYTPGVPHVAICSGASYPLSMGGIWANLQPLPRSSDVAMCSGSAYPLSVSGSVSVSVKRENEEPVKVEHGSRKRSADAAVVGKVQKKAKKV